MQHVLGAASMAGVILLCFLLVWLLYDIITEYSARRRFARLQALKRFWRETSTAPARKVGLRNPTQQRGPLSKLS
jgi:hypothetical protein